MTQLSIQFGNYVQQELAGVEPPPDGDQPGEQAMVLALRAIGAALATDDMTAAEEYARTTASRRVREGITLDLMLDAFSRLRSRLWQLFDAFLADQQLDCNSQDSRIIEDMLYRYYNAYFHTFSDTYHQVQQDLRQQNEQLEAQRRTIRELSTPILPIYPGVIVLPLVGSVDSYRAAQIMESLLSAITESQADLVIVDITGVPLVDTGVAHYLLQTTRAARLVGAHVVLVGIGSEIAQTVVQLGVDLSDVTIHANLQLGIEYALARLGHAIT
jgi:rsbT co-antagonist protein RsbR